MSVKITNTPTKVLDPKRVREIIKTYFLNYIDIRVKKKRGEWILDMKEDDLSAEYGLAPCALRVESLPDPEEYRDEDEWDEAVGELLGEKGIDGFSDLLLDLAPHLKDPLVILTSVQFEGDSWARAWCVQPKDDKVQILVV